MFCRCPEASLGGRTWPPGGTQRSLSCCGGAPSPTAPQRMFWQAISPAVGPHPPDVAWSSHQSILSPSAPPLFGTML